jgi:hypothetical protein
LIKIQLSEGGGRFELGRAVWHVLKMHQMRIK